MESSSGFPVGIAPAARSAMDADALRGLIELRESRNGQELLQSVGGLERLAAQLSSDINGGLTEESAARNKVRRAAPVQHLVTFSFA